MSPDSSTELLQTRVVRDALAYLQLAINPEDRAAWLRIADRPRRGLQSVCAALVEEPATLAELPARAAEFGPEVVAAAASLMATMYELHALHRRGTTPAALLDRALDRSGYRLWLEHHPDGTRRLRLLLRLRALLDRLEIPLAEWLDRAALGEDLTSSDDGDRTVRLTSVHGSNSHEFRAAFVIGLEGGLIPHHRAIAAAESEPDGESLQEELRALYVCVTRARERMWLSACRNRTRGERTEPRQPSRWLQALLPDLVAV